MKPTLNQKHLEKNKAHENKLNGLKIWRENNQDKIKQYTINNKEKKKEYDKLYREKKLVLQVEQNFNLV